MMMIAAAYTHSLAPSNVLTDERTYLIDCLSCAKCLKTCRFYPYAEFKYPSLKSIN